jgi:predicted dienelactone hydrolase
MKSYFFILIILAFFADASFAQSYLIGNSSKTFRDNSRRRNVKTLIYYPSSTRGSNTPVANGTFPVIVLGHGFVMGSDAYQNFYDQLVPKGYIIVFVNMEGSVFANHDAFSKDLAFMVNAMQAENNISTSPFYGKISPKSALMGHSMGGGAAVVAASLTPVATLVTFAPATLRINTLIPASLVDAPAIVFSGNRDGVTPPADHHIPIYNNLGSACKYFISINGGGHCYFANTNSNCDLGERASSGNLQISRSEQQATTFKFLNSWLAYHLKDDQVALQTFATNLLNSPEITPQNNCNNSVSIDSKVNLYPNPATPTDFLNVEVTENQKLSKIEIYNEQGEKLLNSNTPQFEIKGLAKGRYFVKIYFENNTVTTRVLLVR